jgi:hypothetical protein
MLLKFSKERDIKMNLTVKERIQLMNLLPAQGDFRTIKVIHILKMKLGFADYELKDLEFKDLPNGQIKWNPSETIDRKEVELNRVESEIISQTLRKLEKESQLNVEHLTLYEKFCEDSSTFAIPEQK